MISALTCAATIKTAVGVFERALDPFGIRIQSTDAPGQRSVPIAQPPGASDEWRLFSLGKRAMVFDPMTAAPSRNEGFFWRDPPDLPTAVKITGPLAYSALKFDACSFTS